MRRTVKRISAKESEEDQPVYLKLRVPWVDLYADRRAREVGSHSILDRFLRRTSDFDQFLFPKSGSVLVTPKRDAH